MNELCDALGLQIRASGGLFSKLSKLSNPEKYTVGWEPAFNSSTNQRDALVSEEIGNTGYALKFYPTKNGEKNAIGLVKSNSLKHFAEAALEIEESEYVKYFPLNDDWLIDSHYWNAVNLINTLYP